MCVYCIVIHSKVYTYMFSWTQGAAKMYYTYRFNSHENRKCLFLIT